MLNNEEEMIKAKTEALKLHIASLENDIKKLNQESDKVLAEHALILGNFYDINYLYELYCKPESDDKKRKYYLGQYAKYYKEEINKIKELQESPLGIAQIESQYQTKKHELFDKYHHLLKDDVNMLQDSNRYFETVGFVKYGNDRINDQKLNEEFKDFFNNTFMPKEKEFKQKIQELNDTLKNISYKNIEHSQENLDKITRELSALEKENNTLLSFTEEQYLDYLKENGRSLTKELINSKKIAANESKIKGYNDNIKKLSKEIALNEKIIKHYNERENRFIEYRKNELSNLNTYNQLKDMLPEERDKALLEKFMNLKAEVKALNQYNDVMKPKGYSALLSKKSEFQSKIDLLKVENKSIEAKNKQINALIKENNAKIEGIKTYLKENASYKKSQNQIDDDRKILTSLEALRKYTTILLDSNTNKLLKTNTFLKMASDYLDVTEGVYVLKQDKNPLLKLPNKEYYPIKMAFDSYMHYTKAQTLKIDPTNFNLELLDLKAIHLMDQSLSSSINVINKEINRLDKIVYNPFSVIKEQSLKKQAKLRQKYNLAQKTYESDKKLFDETTTAIANYTEKLEALNSKLKDYRNKIATSGENLSYSKEMFEKNISENEYLFQAKIKIRKQINESIDNTKKAYNEELKALEDEYSLKRSEAINKNNEASQAHIIILKMLSYISSSFSNLNTFIDVFICTLFAFFVLYQPKFKHQKSIKIFRTMTILPVIYIVASFILIGFNKMGYISYGIEFGALLIHRSYVCLLFFIFIILYIKYKRKTMSNEDDDKYLGYVNTNRGLMYFNIVIVSVLLVLSTFDFLLSFIPNSEYFNVGSSYYIIVGIPFLLLFNSQRKKHNKITNVLIASYMTIIGLIITGIFIMISAEAFNYIELIAQIFKAFKEI